jgi:hypothetical protein
MWIEKALTLMLDPFFLIQILIQGTLHEKNTNVLYVNY